MIKELISRLNKRIHNYFDELESIDLLDFNQFIFKNLILKLFKTENILPFIIATCIIGFSIITQASRFIFIPQTSIAAFASFFIFTLTVSIITLIIYPVILIFIVNFLTSHIKKLSRGRLWLKFLILFAGYGIGIQFLTNRAFAVSEKILIITIWAGVYLVLSSLYLTYVKHNTLTKLSKTKIALFCFIAIITGQPMVLIYLHLSEAMNFTNINPQVYLSAPNCALLHNLDGINYKSTSNSIFYNTKYYQELPNDGGCYLYGNTIRYSFAYDFVLLVKTNINPIKAKNGVLYNEYVRLSCYAGNCYSQAHIFFKSKDDLYNDLIIKGDKFDHPLF